MTLVPAEIASYSLVHGELPGRSAGLHVLTDQMC